MNHFSIDDIQYSLGENKIKISDLFDQPNRIIERTGINHVYETNFPAEELAYKSANKIIENINSEEIECLIYITQSQKNILPGSGVLLHKKLGLLNKCAVFDVNAGCSGFVQGLILASSLLKFYKKILITCSDTYRKKLDENDRSTKAVFSDGSASILISDEKKLAIKKIVSQIDGGKDHMLIQNQNNNNGKLHMSGRELWNFTRLNVVPDIKKVVNFFEEIETSIDGIFIHQASKVVVDGIKNEVGNTDKFYENYSDRGNTVSSTIPILMKDSYDNFNSKNIILSGFGVGLMAYTLGIIKIKD